jgi:hypothetical protein
MVKRGHRKMYNAATNQHTSAAIAGFRAMGQTGMPGVGKLNHLFLIAFQIPESRVRAQKTSKTIFSNQDHLRRRRTTLVSPSTSQTVVLVVRTFSCSRHGRREGSTPEPRNGGSGTGDRSSVEGGLACPAEVPADPPAGSVAGSRRPKGATRGDDAATPVRSVVGCRSAGSAVP